MAEDIQKITGISILEDIWNEILLYKYQRQWMNLTMTDEERLAEDMPSVITPTDGSRRPIRGYTPDEIIIDDIIEESSGTSRPQQDDDNDRNETSPRDDGIWPIHEEPTHDQQGISFGTSLPHDAPKQADYIEHFRLGKYTIEINHDQDKVEVYKTDDEGYLNILLRGSLTDCMNGVLNLLGGICNMRQVIKGDNK